MRKGKFSSDMRHSSRIIWASAPNLHTLDPLYWDRSVPVPVHPVSGSYDPLYPPSSTMLWAKQEEGILDLRVRGQTHETEGHFSCNGWIGTFSWKTAGTVITFQCRMRVQSFPRCVSANDLLDLIYKHKSKWNVTLFYWSTSLRTNNLWTFNCPP